MQAPPWVYRLAYAAVMAWWGVYVYSFYVQRHGESFLPILARLPNGTANLGVAQLGLVVGVSLFCATVFVDPGVVHTSQSHRASGQVCDVDNATAEGVHHCRWCGHNVVWFDHHCKWMGCCVGLRNMRLFLAFTAFHVLLSAYAVVQVGHFMVVIYTGLLNKELSIVQWTVELLSAQHSAPWWAAAVLCPHAVLREMIHGVAAFGGVSLASHSIEAARALLPAHSAPASGGTLQSHDMGGLQIVLLVLDSQSLAMWTLCLAAAVTVWLGRALVRTLAHVCQGTTYYQCWRALSVRGDPHPESRETSAGCVPTAWRSPPGLLNPSSPAPPRRDLGACWANFRAMCACQLPPASTRRVALVEARRALALSDKAQ